MQPLMRAPAGPLLPAALALSTMLLGGPAHADPTLAEKKNCMGCHAVDERRVGPAFKAVAAKYAGQADAADKLAQKVLKGGAGNWGAVPMPENRQVTPAEARQLAQWVLSLK